MAFLIVIYIEEIKRGQALMRERLKEFKDLLDEERILHAKMEAYYFKWNLQEELEGNTHNYDRSPGDGTVYAGCFPTTLKPAQSVCVSQETIDTPINDENNEKAVQKNISQKSLKEEIKEMLLELDIKGHLKTRKNGLLELRTVNFGSVYGRTKEELSRKLSKKIQETKTKRSPKQKKNTCPTLIEFYEQNYLPYKKADGLAAKTLKGMGYNFSFIVKSGFNKPLNEYTSLDITNFLLSIPKTRKRQIIQGFFNNLFTYAKSLGKIKENPSASIATMKHDTVEGTSLSFHEQKYFFVNLLADPKISHVKKCYSIFIYLTGTRRNEALDLTTEDVQRVLHINGTKTDGSDRYVPLLPLVEKLLKSITPKDGKYFPFSEYVADTTFKKYGAPHKLHDLRHTYGTIQICVNKLDIKTVSLYMGHSTIETTLRIYTHPEQLDRETFLNGSLKEEERLEILRKEYAEILAIIEDFLK